MLVPHTDVDWFYFVTRGKAPQGVKVAICHDTIKLTYMTFTITRLIHILKKGQIVELFVTNHPIINGQDSLF